MGYCYFSLQDYVNASDCYEQLTVLYPEQEQYKLHYAQALYKCGLHEESFRAASQIENAELKSKVYFYSCFRNLQIILRGTIEKMPFFQKDLVKGNDKFF